MKTKVRDATGQEFQYGSGKTHPFRLCLDDADAEHGHDEDGHTFPATRTQLRKLARQIAELLDD